MGGVQPHVVEPVALHLLHDAPGHDVAPSVSVWWSAQESPSPMAAAIPPCAYRVALSSRSALVTISTSRTPAARARRAVNSPAMPLPTTISGRIGLYLRTGAAADAPDCAGSESMRSSARQAAAFTWSDTVISFSTRPSTRASRTHARYAGWIRYIVEHGQITGSRQKIRLSGWAAASRVTMLISVAAAQW